MEVFGGSSAKMVSITATLIPGTYVLNSAKAYIVFRSCVILRVLNEKHYSHFEGEELRASAIKGEKCIQTQVCLNLKPLFSCVFSEISVSLLFTSLTLYIFGDTLLCVGPVLINPQVTAENGADGVGKQGPISVLNPGFWNNADHLSLF